MNAIIPITQQEREFALACRDFLGQRNPVASQRIEIHQSEVVVPDNDRLRQDFLDFGVSRLMKVFQAAIDNRAISPQEATTLIVELATFGDKIVIALVPRSNTLKH